MHEGAWAALISISAVLTGSETIQRYIMAWCACVCVYEAAGAVSQNSTRSPKSAYHEPNVKQQEDEAVDSTYMGVVVGTITTLVVVLVILVALVLLRRRICKPSLVGRLAQW